MSVPLLTWSNPTPRGGRPGRVELVEAESAFVSEVKGAEEGERGLVGESAGKEKRPPKLCSLGRSPIPAPLPNGTPGSGGRLGN